MLAQQKSIGEVIREAAPRQSPNIPVEQVMVSISQELNQPDTIVEQFGDTVFIAHPAQQAGFFVFRALNADTPRNYIRNGIEFLTVMRDKYQAHILMVEFKDPVLIDVMRMIHQTMGSPPDIQYAVQKFPAGYRLIIMFGTSFNGGLQ